MWVNGAKLVTLFQVKFDALGDEESGSSDAIRTFAAGDVLSYRWISNVPADYVAIVAMRVMATRVG